MVYKRDVSRAVGALILPKSKPRRRADPGIVKDGWHKVKEYSLYVEDGRVLRATKPDPQSFSGGYLPAQIYVWDARNHVWTNARGVKYSTARNGIYKGTYGVF